MNRAISAVAIATICLCGCARRQVDDTDALARRYVRLALALAARDSDSLDFYAGPADWRRDAERAYRPLADVRRDLVALERDLGAGAHDARQRFLGLQAAALVARIDILAGQRPRFADESARLFGVIPPGPDPARADAVRRDLDRQLPGRGDLAARYAEYLRRSIVPPAQVPAAFAAALAACRAETLRHLALPADERVSVDYAARDTPWSAFTRYAGGHRSTIEVNTAFAFTRDDLADLACHEGYPGHHTAYVLRDDALVRAEHRIELTIEPLFSPQSLLDEATAAYAPSLAFPEANGLERLAGALDPARLDILRRYLDGDLEFARAAAALERDTLVPSSGAVLKFVNEFRSYIVTYTVGRERVAGIVARAPAGQPRWDAFRTLLLAGTLPPAAPAP